MRLRKEGGVAHDRLAVDTICSSCCCLCAVFIYMPSLLASVSVLSFLVDLFYLLAGRGLLLNNEMTDFDPLPFEESTEGNSNILTANRVEGGKLPRTTAIGLSLLSCCLHPSLKLPGFPAALTHPPPAT